MAGSMTWLLRNVLRMLCESVFSFCRPPAPCPLFSAGNTPYLSGVGDRSKSRIFPETKYCLRRLSHGRGSVDAPMSLCFGFCCPGKWRDLVEEVVPGSCTACYPGT